MDEKGLMSNRNWLYAESGGKKVTIKIQTYAEENGHQTPNMHKAELWY